MECEEVKPEERALWRAQDALVEAMPHALAEAFQKVEAEFFQNTKVIAWPLFPFLLH